MISNTKVGILTGGELDSLQAKMAHGVMRYRDDVVVVIDDKFAGRNVKDILPYVNKNIPIVSTLNDAINMGINELLIGVAPPGGKMPEEWLDIIYKAVVKDIKVINGLHIKLSKLDRFQDIDVNKIIDLRYSYIPKNVAHGKAAELNKNVILTVGSDCASGKMTTALELHRDCLRRGLKSDFIPTGQTGMYIAGKGFAIDAVISDFMAGAIEEFVCESAENNSDYIFVEGQGSILHPAYSGVTLGLIHGSAPNIIVFAHDISRSKLAYFGKEIPSLKEQIDIVERLAGYQRQCKVLGISLFAAGIEKSELDEIIYEMEMEYRIPVFAPLVTGCGKFIDILEEYR
jgi:uncharacterized NAD-dependent epimerase/dehydratase family protein